MTDGVACELSWALLLVSGAGMTVIQRNEGPLALTKRRPGWREQPTENESATCDSFSRHDEMDLRVERLLRAVLLTKTWIQGERSELLDPVRRLLRSMKKLHRKSLRTC